MSNKFNTPVLLNVFNRPKLTRAVINVLRDCKIPLLYVHCDGPRCGNYEDIDRVKSVQHIIDEDINWECEVHKLYESENLGCGEGPYRAITWFFSNVEQGIILEDDCVPHPDFFMYCQILLEKYKNDERICHIGGNNNGYLIKQSSYTFASGHHQTWGWATWKRSWQFVDYYLEDLSFSEFKKSVRFYYKDIRQQEYWWKIYDLVKKDRMNDSCWDYQYMFSCWRRHSLAIAPSVNLVSNIGDGTDATHTQGESSVLHIPTRSILPLTYPIEVKLDKGNDDYMMRNRIIPYQYGWRGLRNFPYRINALIKRAVGHDGPWIKKGNNAII